MVLKSVDTVRFRNSQPYIGYCETAKPGSLTLTVGGESNAESSGGPRRPKPDKCKPTFTVEAEYGAADSAGRPPGAGEPGCGLPEQRGIASEQERRERVAELIAEAVYRYLKRRGHLPAQADGVAGKAPEDGSRAGNEILDDSLDFRAQPTGTYDCYENG